MQYPVVRVLIAALCRGNRLRKDHEKQQIRERTCDSRCADHPSRCYLGREPGVRGRGRDELEFRGSYLNIRLVEPPPAAL